MFIIGCVMFVLATMHVGTYLVLPPTFPNRYTHLFKGMNCFRMVRGYVDEVNSPGGAAAFLSNLAPWDHIFKDTIYATTEMLGDGVAVSGLHI